MRIIKMTKSEFQYQIKTLKQMGWTSTMIAKRIGYSKSQFNKATSDKWTGNCDKLISKFELVLG